LSIPWFEMLREIERDPDFLFLFARHPRRFEEFIAASYERAGWPQVELTPPSADGGRDVIATMPGVGSVRFLEQCKAYSPGRLVTHNDVRAMLGVLQTSSNASKGIVTTTSGFQPGIFKTKEFEPFLPYRLELRDGKSLRRWLQQIADEIP
jgi:restriction system protein